MPEHTKPAVLSIDSFKGGRTNFLDQTTIDNSMCTSGSMNVWAPNGVLTKMPGFTLASSFTASGSTIMNGLWCDDNISTANRVFYNIFMSATGAAAASGQSYLFGSSYTLTDSLNPLGYTVGTVAVNGVSATGSGTSWGSSTGSAGILAGDRFQSSQNTNGWYFINSVEDNTHLTLAAAVPTAITAGTNYIIQQTVCGPNSSLDIAETSLNGNIIFTFFNQFMVRYDGSNMYRMIASSTASLTPPGANFLTTFQGYSFSGYPSYSQVPTNNFPSRITWSALNDPTTWPVNNFIDIDLLHGGNISGLVAFGQELIVFKNRGMYKVIGNVFDPTNPTYYVQKITTPSDFVFNSNQSCAIHTRGNANITYSTTGINYTNTVLIFYASGFIYTYQQGTTFITRLSDAITLDMPNSSGGNSFSITNFADQQLKSVSYNGYYLLAGLKNLNYTDPSPSISLLMDRNDKFWLAHNTNSTASSGTWMAEPFSPGGLPSFAVLPSSTQKAQLMMSSPGFTGQTGSNNTSNYGRIYLMNLLGPTYTTTYPVPEIFGQPISYSDGSINGIWVSKEFNIEYGTFNKIVVYLKKQSGIAGANNLTVQWSIDQGSPVSYTIDQTTGRGTVIRAVIDVRQKGSTIQLTLSNNVVSQTFGIYAIKIYYTPSEDERLL